MPAARPSPDDPGLNDPVENCSLRASAPRRRCRCRCDPEPGAAPLPRVLRLAELHRQEPGRLRAGKDGKGRRDAKDPHDRRADPGDMLRGLPRRVAAPCRATRSPGRLPPRPHTRRGGVEEEARHAAAWYARALADVVHGHRALPPLLHHTSSDVYRELERLRAALCGGPATPGRPTIRSWHVFGPDPDVLEVSTHLTAGGRSRALAFRLERDQRERWRCTAVQAG